MRWFPRRFPVRLHWHTATLSHARESFLEARRGWRARVNSRGTRRADRRLRIMCSPRAETGLERAAEQDTTHRARAQHFTLYFYISEQSDAPEARGRARAWTHTAASVLFERSAWAKKMFQKKSIWGFAVVTVFRSSASERLRALHRQCFSAFFPPGFLWLKKSWLRTSPPPPWEVSFYICAPSSSGVFRQLRSCVHCQESCVCHARQLKRIKGNEVILMEINNIFRNFEDLLCCLHLKITD